MRYGNPSIIAAALLAIVPLAHANADDGDEKVITIIGSPSLIPEGSRCLIHLKPVANRKDTVATTFEGTVVEASAGEIVLAVAQTRRVSTANSPGAKIPLVNRLFRNIGIAATTPGEPRIVTIAAETIQSVQCFGLPEE
ncbi:hypothetical protein [Tautonia marina]|uniref:hypothetical protein n=1 Tax=Tautonia marina TaxID=2653855 RepID=UPI0012613411|nr:hypothetical protein [Tautonia marina]